MLLAILLTAAQLSAPSDPITGKWQLKGDVAGNPINTICDFTQTGTAITGICTGSDGRPQPITGDVKGDSVTFKHGGDYQGTELTIIYAGKLETPKQLKGTILVKPFDADGSFTAEPVPAKK
jgi:hypothetical protein